jgi:hypothetical protein
MTQSLPMEYFVNVTLLCHLLEALKISSNRSFIGNNLVMAYCIRLILVCSISHGPELVPSQSLLWNIFLYIQIFYWKHIKEETYEESSQGIHPRLPQNSGFFYSQFTFHTAKCCHSLLL